MEQNIEREASREEIGRSAKGIRGTKPCRRQRCNMKRGADGQKRG
jgi:hypothetical protein